MDRWKKFISSPAIHEFSNLHKIAAVNGKRMPFKKERRISIHTRYNILRNYRRSHYEIATLGAIGATMSHVNTWKKFYASKEPLCIIMEDDAIWTPQLIEIANSLYNTLPTDCGMWIIGHHPSNTVFESLHDEHGWNRIHNFTGAHSYMLTREAAKLLLEEPFPIETHIEFYMTATAALKGFTIIQHPHINIRCGMNHRGFIISNSNTLHRNKYGCPACNVHDDLSQLYSRFTRRGNKGTLVSKPLYERKSMEGGRRTRRRRHRV